MMAEMTETAGAVTENPGRLARFGVAAIEFIAALLVVLNVIVLFVGVVARYGFGRPIIWSDELAVALFLWLGMLGAVMASQREEHLRLSALVKNFPPRARRYAAALAYLIMVVFIGTLVRPAYNYMIDQWMIITPGLDIPDSFRVASLFVGSILLGLVAVYLMLTRCQLTDLALAAATIAGVAAILWLGEPVLHAMGNFNLIVFFVLIVGAMVVMGVPIAFAFGTTSLAYLVFVTDVPLFILVNQMDHGMSSLVLLAIPLFIFLGLLIDITGMAVALVNFLAALVGHFRGGLSYVLLGAMYLVSGISGAKAADMAAIAPVLLPEMKKRGYEEGESVALLAASSAMSETIPPSLILIMIGSVTGLSIAALFTAGLLPAAIGAVALAVMAYYRSRKSNLTTGLKPSRSMILKLTVVAVPALVLPLLIRVAVVEGVATATEVSTIGVVYTMIVGPIVYSMNWRRLYPILVETAALSGAILFIIGCATTMGWALTQSGFASQLVVAMQALPGGKWSFMAISIVLFAVLGSLLEGIPAIVLFGPLLFPVATALGINDVHYSMVAILAMGLGLFSPPFGLGFYISCAVGKVEPDQVWGRVFPYLGALAIAVLLIAAIPWFSTVFL
jgi:tripartite ATP-independent transporter DctM subunit